MDSETAMVLERKNRRKTREELKKVVKEESISADMHVTNSLFMLTD